MTMEVLVSLQTDTSCSFINFTRHTRCGIDQCLIAVDAQIDLRLYHCRVYDHALLRICVLASLPKYFFMFLFSHRYRCILITNYWG